MEENGNDKTLSLLKECEEYGIVSITLRTRVKAHIEEMESKGV